MDVQRSPQEMAKACGKSIQTCSDDRSSAAMLSFRLVRASAVSRMLSCPVKDCPSPYTMTFVITSKVLAEPHAVMPCERLLQPIHAP